MADIEKVVDGLNKAKAVIEAWIPMFEQYNSPFTIDCAIELLKEQQQRIEQLEIDRDILAKDINTNNCNTCKRECEHRPMPGEVVRANCFMWEGT